MVRFVSPVVRTKMYLQGEVIQEGSVGTNEQAMAKVFGSIAIEVGMHTPWVNRLLRALGHEVVVGNPRHVKLISVSTRKDDRLDAQNAFTSGTDRPAVAQTDPASQCESAGRSDGDRSASGSGGSAHQPDRRWFPKTEP
jgi:transposase